jgi:tetratricopeptide (TPR) repeat protein
MGLFSRKRVLEEYDRESILAGAALFEKRGQRQRAADEYQKVLRWEPENHALRTKLAVLLAEIEPNAAAWNHFLGAAEGYVRESFIEKGIAVYRQAAAFFPCNVDVWEALARHYMTLRRKPDALKALLDGRRHFTKLTYHQQATQLLRHACQIEPWHLEATLDLSRLRARTRGRDEAKLLLAGLAARNRGKNLRRVRAAQFRLSPTPAAGWRWLRSALRGA